jgi:SPX domain protein involved in polyphosphate accumulation
LTKSHTSSLSHTIRSSNRFELKYLVPIKAAEQFKRALRTYLVPDDNGDSRGRYDVSSLYYDGPGFGFYWERADGVKLRRKLRIRHYESSRPLSAHTPVFVEIKQRLNRVTQKRRVSLAYRDALRLCNGRQRPQACCSEHTAQDAAVLHEVESMLWQYDLRPASIVRYLRQALIGTEHDICLRVTFDTCLHYCADQLQLHERARGLQLFPADWVIVEIKVNERIPYWLTELVAAHNLNLVRVSKYCRSIELAHHLSAPAWRLALARV